MEKCNISMILTQAIGEYEDRISANELTVVASGLEEEVYGMADGRYLWRIFDNLLGNIAKYAQAGTRVYIDLEGREDVVVTFKNVSRYPLNISETELMERFVQGDRSRVTEGSGLGLSIAGSLADLMGGSLSLKIDGDLFKAQIILKRPNES